VELKQNELNPSLETAGDFFMPKSKQKKKVFFANETQKSLLLRKKLFFYRE